MVILLALVGAGLIVVVLWDALETVVLPRRIVSRVRLTSLFYRLTWIPWSTIGRSIGKKRNPERFLWLYGPLSVLVLIIIWAVGLIIGVALLCSASEGGSSGHSLYL